MVVPARWKRPLTIAVVAGGALFLGAQFIRPALPDPPVTADLEVPAPVKAILRRSCYDCHSNETNLRWYDQIVPAYWLVARDVREGRARLNFSEIGKRPPAAQKGALFEAVNFIALGAMPPGQYTALHRDAKVTPGELEILKDYLHPQGAKTFGAPSTATAAPPIPRAATEARPAPNGLAFVPAYKDWQAISATERFDNGTLRVITGNAIAIKAIADGQVHPWPDGAALAKIAWVSTADGHAGDLKQIELMVKGAREYADTEGWGFGRWLGLDLKPYGEDATFTRECAGCHAPMRANDYVYSLPLKAAPAPADVFNPQGALPAEAFDSLGWQIVASSVDAEARTMAILYGNVSAVAHARAAEPGPYPAGAELARVTWAERDDPHWFGARIPDRARSIERVTLGAGAEGKPSYAYERFAGDALVKSAPLEGAALETQVEGLLGERASALP